jgi:outer membrane protein OmpA-like peptidoglycan-associated protein
MKREAYIDIPTANLNEGLYIVVNSSYPIKDVDDVKLDPNLGVNFTYDNFGGALKWYDGADFAFDFSWQILAGNGNIPCIAVGVNEINVNKYISTAGTDEVFNDENFTHRPPEAWSFYVVAGKKLNRLIEVNAGLGRGKFVGYGTLYKYINTDMFTDGNHEVWAFGLFGGMKIMFTNRLAFIAEGDGRDVNIGLEYQNKLIKGTLSLNKLEVFNDSEQDFSPRVGLNLSYKIMNLRKEDRKEEKTLSVFVELIGKESRSPVEGNAIITDTKGDTVEISKVKSIHSFKLEPGIYNSFVSATGYKDRKISMMVKEELDKNLYTIELAEIEDTVKPEELQDSVEIINKFEYIKSEIEGISIKFPFRKADLTPIARDKLKGIIKLISDNKDVNLLVIGHTCSIGISKTNQRLSERRAESVKKYLIEHHISADRISTKGYGETKPVADNSTEEGRIKNRRAEFILYQAKDEE